MNANIEMSSVYDSCPGVPPKPRMLLVEDDPSTCVALRKILGHKGWDVSVAATLAAADSLLHIRPVCVILDLMLPDGNGLKLLQTIRERQLPIRVVVVTGSSDTNSLRNAVGLKPDALLRKPLDLAEFLRVIDGEEPLH